MGSDPIGTKEECLRSQIATLNEARGKHLKYMPYVFIVDCAEAFWRSGDSRDRSGV